MKCSEFWKKYNNIGLTPELEAHLDSCTGCRDEMLIERALDSSIEQLPIYEAPDHIWENIAASIPEKQVTETSAPNKLRTLLGSIFAPDSRRSLKPLFAGLTIVFLATVIFMYYNSMPLSAERKQKLQAKAIEKIEKSEQEYLESIELLTELAESNKANIDPEVYDAYREKLTLLDDYILECKNAINENQYNPQVRSYLAMAYKEKTDTLREMMNYSQQ